MDKIAAIVLLGLLGFLGCSGSDDDGTSTFTGEASPVTPFGIIDILDPSYQWTPVPGASRYCLLVQDANQASTTQDTAENAVIDEWYTAEEARCASEEVLCTVHPGIVTIGENTWKVQACASQECGFWSEPLDYDVSPTPLSSETRFTFHGDGTFTDNYTTLMWTMTRHSGLTTWEGAINFCNDLVLPDGGYSDWRLPTLYELYPLTLEQSILPQDVHLWTTTEVWGPEDPSLTYVVYSDGSSNTYKKYDVNDSGYGLPVRGGYH